MKNLKEKKVKYVWGTIILPTGAFVVLLVGLFIGINQFDKVNKEQNLLLTKQAIRKAATQCYAIEGMYPAEISYLEDNYFINIDYDTYYVVYDCIASNFMPDIEVFEK